MGWIATAALRDVGFSDEQIAQLDAARSDLYHVAATLKALQPRFTRLGLCLDMILEVLNKPEG